MTKQEAFDKMVAHLAAQKQRCTSEGGSCLYRGPGGRKCVVGAMISDEVYDLLVRKKMSAGGVSMIWDYVKAQLFLEDDESGGLRFYAQFQNVHDGSYTVESLRGRLHDIADDYKLDPALISTITEWK